MLKLDFSPPSDWTVAPLENVALVQTGIAKGKQVNGNSVDVPYLRVANVQDGHVDLSVIKQITVRPVEVDRYLLQSGDVLFTEGGDFDKLGRGTVWAGQIEPCLHQNHVFAVRPDKKKLLPEILAAQASSRHGRRYFQLSSKQSTNLASINSSQLKRFPVVLPPLPEQHLIAEILRTWDKAIAKMEALRTAKEARLNVLREKLTFADAAGEPTRLGDVSEEITTRNGDGAFGREMVMGVTNSRGIVPMREQTIAEDISRYKLVPHLGFAYNPMRINVGSIAMNESTETILVSPDYVVFSCLEGGLSPDFLDHLRKTKWWAHYINSGGSGSVRQRTYYADLAAMKVPLPTYKEQVHIAKILNTGKQDVDFTAHEITTLQRQKRGLMQKLLTGEWRVEVDTVAETTK